MTLAQLYTLAYARGFPHAVARDVIRGLAEDLRAKVDRLTEGQAERILMSLRGMAYDSARDPKAQRPEREREVTDGHRDQIRTLASLLGWTTGTLDRFLLRSVRVIGLRGLVTADQAEQVLQMLRAVRDGRRQRHRKPERQRARV